MFLSFIFSSQNKGKIQFSILLTFLIPSIKAHMKVWFFVWKTKPIFVPLTLSLILCYSRALMRSKSA